MTSTTTDRLNGVNASLSSKAPVRVATTANITLSGAQTIDGVAVVADDRVLVKNQTDGIENGIYDAKTGAWVRAKDWDGARDVVAGTFVVISEGTAGAGLAYWLSTTGDITVGTTSIAFTLLSITTASAWALTLLDDESAGAARITLGLVIGTHVLAPDGDGSSLTGISQTITESFVISATPETTLMTTGTAKITFRMPYAFTLTDIRGSVTTAPTGSGIIVDVNLTGTGTLMTNNKITIDATGFSSEDAGTQPALTTTSLADDAEITIDIDQIGSTIAGKGLKITLIGTQT